MCHFVIAANREIVLKDFDEVLDRTGPVCGSLPRDSCLELEVPQISTQRAARY